MRLVDYLDKGASLGPDQPCLTTDGDSMSYAEVVELSSRVAASLAGCGVSPGDKVAILSANDPIAFSCVFGISRAAAVWCPINPAQRGRGEPGAARPLRLRRADLPVLVRSPGVVDQGRTAQTHHLDLSRPPARMGVQVGGLPGPRYLCYSGRARRGDHTGRRRRHDRRHRRHHWSAQRSDADWRKPRDDDRADVARLPLRGSPDLSRARAADPRRRRAVLPGPRPRRRGRDHAGSRRRRVPRAWWRSTRSRTRSCRRP